MMNDFQILEVARVAFGLNALRYFLASGLAFLIFYIIFRHKLLAKKIQDKFPSNKDYRREVMYSMITICMFTLVAISLFGTPLRQYTQVYMDVNEYSAGYWVLSVLLMIVLHDIYFYWMHRAIHLPSLYKHVHLVHHRSVNPSPWASYAFHPIEGFLEAAVIYPIAFLIPYHPTALMSFLVFMIVYNVYGHLGYEIIPRRLQQSLVGRWLNTSVDHNVHHKHFSGNYGLYFLFWDRMMGTYRQKEGDLLREKID